MKSFESVVVVGSSCSGKTTLVNGLRTEEYQDKLTIPQRYITRPIRHNDDLTENLPIGKENFKERANTGRINPHWERILDGGRRERYGFAAVAPEDERLRIYSANNAFLRDRSPSVTKVLDSGLVIFVMATTESRDTRLDERSPDMLKPERFLRLEDRGVDILHAADVEIEVIDTTHLSPTEGQLALQSIVDELV